MEEFLRQNYSLITRFFEVLAAIVGLVYYKKYKNSYAKYFIWFLVGIVFIEIIGGYPRILKNNGLYHLIDDTIFERNYWWYSIFWTIGSALFFSWYFKKVNSIFYYKNLIKLLRFGFIIFVVVFLLVDWKKFFYSSSVAVTIAGEILIIFSSFLYFLDLLLSSKILEFYKSISFYIASTIFIWFLITSCLDFFEGYYNPYDKEFVDLKRQIYIFSNIFMYSVFTFALIWCKKPSI